VRTTIKKFFLRVAKGYKLRTYMIRFDPKEISLVKEKNKYILTAKTGAVKISLVKERTTRVPSSINYPLMPLVPKCSHYAN
jgi:hypothetical protein